MERPEFQNLRVYRLSEDLADFLWDLVIPWDNFAKDTVGKQLVRAADSIGANIAEGCGRGTYKENRHFVRIGRGSMNETLHFLRRAYRRRLLTDEQIAQIRPMSERLPPTLSAYLRSIGTKRGNKGNDGGTPDSGFPPAPPP